MPRNTALRVFICFFACAGIAVISAAYVSAASKKSRQARDMAERQRVETKDATFAESHGEAEPPPLEAKSYSVLLCGIDHTRTLADVIIYAKLDIPQRRVRVLQIPRDLFIGERTATGKINSLCLPFSSSDPTRRIADVISSQLGLDIDGVAAITLAGVRALVDSVGGVRITLENAIEFLPGKVIPAGESTLSGEQAEWLLRHRRGYEMGDLDRLKMQRQFMLSAADTARGLSRVNALAIAARNIGHIKTNIPFSEICSLIELWQDLKTDDIDIETIPVYGEKYNGFDVLCINRFKLAQVLNSGVRSADPVDPWQLSLCYPPKAQSSSQQSEDGGAFDFRWEFDDGSDLDDAEGVVIRKNNGGK